MYRTKDRSINAFLNWQLGKEVESFGCVDHYSKKKNCLNETRIKIFIINFYLYNPVNLKQTLHVFYLVS